MTRGEISSSPWIISVTFFFLCCLTQLCTASPSGGRQPVTYLSGKIPPLPFSRGLLRGGLGGDVSSSGALRSGHDGSTEVDVGEDEEDIYGLSHFWYNMVHYAQSLVSETNFTLSSELTEVNSKIEQLESSLVQRDEEISSLREALDKLAKEKEEPSLGDVRLIHQKEEANHTSGVLLLYAGGKLGWGYVCDDMFSSVAATVACRQLGYLSGKMGVALGLTLDLDPQDRKRSFVLDDVRCKEGDANLMSCDHLPLGVHNCGLSETVKVKCSR